MTGAQALAAVRAAGGDVELDGADLVLTVTAEPPADVLEAVRRHKAELLILLRAEVGQDGWVREDWQAYFDDRAGTIENDGGLVRIHPERTRIHAEIRAYESCVVEWLNRHPVTSPPGRCLACGGSDRTGDVLLPFGVASLGHCWVHSHCWPAWHAKRESEAVAALAMMPKPHRRRKPDSELDLWETPPVALEVLLGKEEIYGSVLEPCAGRGSLVKLLRSRGNTVLAGDIVERDFPLDYVRDFREVSAADFDSSFQTLVTNFPYGRDLGTDFIRHALTAFPNWKILAFLPTSFFTTGKRRVDLRQQITKVYLFDKRLPRLHLDGYTGKRSSNQTDYMWLLFDPERQPEPPEVLVLP